MKQMSLYSFSTEAASCDVARKFEELSLVSEKSEKYHNTIAVLDIIRLIRTGEAKKEELLDLCAQKNGYELSLAGDSGDFDAEEKYLQTRTLEDCHNLLAYLDEESRENLMYTKDIPELDIRIGDLIVPVKPQFLFVKKGMSFYEVEAGFYRDKKPVTGAKTLLQEIADFRKKNPDSESEDVRLLKKLNKWAYHYMSLLFVRELVTDKDWLEVLGIPEGEKILATGALYHMKSKQAKPETYFGSDRYVNLAATYVAGMAEQAETEIDTLFRAFAHRQAIGHTKDECTADDCRWCSMAATCRIAKEPELLEKAVTASVAGAVSLTPSQQEVVEMAVSGRPEIALVIAKAGSGKTTTMVMIVAELLKRGVPLEKILMATFTKNAAQDFRERVLKELLKDDPAASIEGNNFMTLHRLALDVIRRNYGETGYTEPPKEVNETYMGREVSYLLAGKELAGASDLYTKTFDGLFYAESIAIDVFNIIADEPDILGMDNSEYEILQRLNSAKREKCTHATIAELISLYDDFIDILKADNVILYGQMEPLMHRVLADHPDYLAETYGFEYVILDEWQDSSEMEMETCKALEAMSTRKLLVAVGDDGQSIYAFRRAVVDNITDFGGRLGKPVRQLQMLENWRSTKEILDLADDFLEQNENRTEGRTIAGRTDGGAAPVIRGFHTADDELGFIADEILKNYGDGIPYEKQAFIARTGKELNAAAKAFNDKGIPVVFKNPLKFSENPKVKAAIAFIHNVFYQPETNTGYFAHLCAGYNGELQNVLTAEEVQAELNKMRDRYANIDDLPFAAQKSMLHEDLDSIRGTDEVYAAFLDEYLYVNGEIDEELRFIADFEKYGSKMGHKMNQDYKGVTLVTAHSSKGLEWDAVYNSISEYDRPFMKHDVEETEETRRLLYVSMTRAKNLLYVTGQYLIPGTKTAKKSDGGPSFNRFLRELYDISGQIYDPVDHKKKEKKAEREKAAAVPEKIWNTTGRTKTGGMSEERKKQYDKMTAGAYQQTVEKLFTLPF